MKVQRSVATTQLRNDFDFGGLGKHVERRYGFDLEAGLQLRQVAGQR